MNTFTKGTAKLLTLMAIALGAGTTVKAQLSLSGTSYTQDFNSLAGGLPAGWNVDTHCLVDELGVDVSATYFTSVPDASATSWKNTSGKFKNVASATPYATFSPIGSDGDAQAAETNRALAIRQVGGTDKNVGFVLTIANTNDLTDFAMTFKLQSLDSTSPRQTTWLVDYATGAAPFTFTPATVTGTMTTGGNTYSNNTITVDFGTGLDDKAGPVYIRIVTLTSTTGTSNRTTTAIDDVNLTWTGTATASNILLESKLPVGTNIPLATAALTLKYNDDIQKGTGNIVVHKAADGSVAHSFDVASAAVTIDDSTATVTGLTLENNTEYYVLMGANVFTNLATPAMGNLAITLPTEWTFSTEDTTPSPELTVLNETFTECMNPELGVFTQYSKEGAKRWNCSSFGRTDSHSVYINGGSAPGVSETNKDWLVSANRFDFSAMSSPKLSFWHKRRFEGAVTLSVKISTDYSGTGDPSLATWTDIHATPMPSEDWSSVSNINLNAYKSTPFYLAFTYDCGSAGAYEYTLDDIKVENGMGVFEPIKQATELNVLGIPRSNEIKLALNVLQSGQFTAEVYDLNGRRVHTESFNASSGTNMITMDQINLNAGMHLIKVYDVKNGQAGNVKAVIR